MKYTYLILNLGSLLIPLIFSFHPSIQFYKSWKNIIPSILISAILFIAWDINFTSSKIWGFNSEYHLDITFFYLPLEEWLFFFCIPYACMFTHFCLKKFLWKGALSEKITQFISYFLSGSLFIVALIYIERDYTFYNFLLGSILIIFNYLHNRNELQWFYYSFIIILIPFFIVNGILTGTMLEAPIVWYNDSENLGIRMGSIPLEDVVYAFNMLILPLYISQLLKRKISFFSKNVW